MTLGLYIHIPFCLSKCRYCAFNSYPVPDGVPDYYVRALLRDAGREAPGWEGMEFASVYLGGGTPSLLNVDQLEKIVAAIHSRFKVSPQAEITAECNPNRLTRELLHAYMGLGINRLSLGVQSLSDRELSFLGRRHSSVEARRAFEISRSAGLENISADLIVGIPGQNRKSLTRSLETVCAFADHVSVYLLSVEPGTGLDRLVASGEIAMPDEDEMVQLYDPACALLGSAGFHRYEISNWCKPGSECVHNTMYWKRGGYLGLGAGAHSHLDGSRYAKVSDPWAYALDLAGDGDGVEMRERLDPFQMFMEELMLGLRTDRGIDAAATAAKYGVDSHPLMGRLGSLCAEGYASKKRNQILLSAKGLLLHDAITEELVSSVCPARFSRSA